MKDKLSKEEALKRRRIRHKEYKKIYKIKHRDKYLAEKKRWKEKHKEQIKEYNKRYARKYNPQYAKQYRASNPSRIREIKNKWKKSPQGRFSKKIEKFVRRGRERKIFHEFTRQEWEDKVKSTKGICPMCKKLFDEHSHKLTLDHTPAISKISGIGIYTIDNVNPICASCNSKKGNR